MIRAVFQSLGILPCLIVWLNRAVTAGVILQAVLFNIRPAMLSGPVGDINSNKQIIYLRLIAQEMTWALIRIKMRSEVEVETKVQGQLKCYYVRTDG